MNITKDDLIQDEYLEQRKKAYDFFMSQSNPIYALDIDINFNKIKIPKKKKRFDKSEKGIIHCDIYTLKEKYPEYYSKYYSEINVINENKFTALNTMLCNGGTFLYIKNRKKTKVNMHYNSDFEKNLIIIDEHCVVDIEYELKESEYIYNGMTNIIIGNYACCTFNLKQDFKKDVYNISFIQGLTKISSILKYNIKNQGSHLTHQYPSCILDGENSSCYSKIINISDDINHLDIGFKMTHNKELTHSHIDCKNQISNGGYVTYRGYNIINQERCSSHTLCKTKIKDENTKIDIIPKNICNKPTSIIEFKTRTSKI